MQVAKRGPVRVFILYSFFKYFGDRRYHRYWPVVMTSVVTPFFKIGVKLANFISLGNVPAVIDLLYMCAKEDATKSAANFKSLQGILSNPLAFLMSSVLTIDAP